MGAPEQGLCPLIGPRFARGRASTWPPPVRSVFTAVDGSSSNACSAIVRRGYSRDVVERVHALAQAGVRQADVADRVGLSPSTVSRWLRQDTDASIHSPARPRAISPACPLACPQVRRAPPAADAHLLGQYLGDGTIVSTRRGVHRLFITCCAAHPDIVDECAGAMASVLPGNRVGRRAKPGAIDVNCYSKHLPCLVPQHGPGRKHDRPIELDPWQDAIALRSHPDQFVRGLVHSDGSRFVNRVRNSTGREYAHVRYQFTRTVPTTSGACSQPRVTSSASSGVRWAGTTSRWPAGPASPGST